MESSEQLDKKRSRDSESETSSTTSNNPEEDDFEVPKEHLKMAKKRARVIRPEAVIQKSQSKTSISDVRNVLLWILSESQGSIPKWCMIRNKNLVESVTVIITPFIDRHSLFEYAGSCAGISASMPFFSHCIRGSMIPMLGLPCHRYPAVCPVLSTFLSCSVNPKVPQWVERLSDDEETPDSSVRVTHKISDFVMTEENRRLNDMPDFISAKVPPPGFVTTVGKKTRSGIPDSTSTPEDELRPMLSNPADQALLEADPDFCKLIGIDCEMVDTVAGKELARVSMIDCRGRVLYDAIVIPENEVVDYVTQYSGITAKMIRESTTTFREAQRRVLALLDESAILVGHAINNDLKCLKLIHERLIDTSDIFPHPNGHPSKHGLVFLLQRVMRETLDRDGGHDSVDDARATLKIAMKKIARGWEYSPLGMGAATKFSPLGSLFEGRNVLFADLKEEEQTQYKMDGFELNPESDFADAKLRVHVVKDYQIACETNTPRPDALVAVDRAVREIVGKLKDHDLVIVFSGCGDVHSFKKFELLADKCEDPTQLNDVTKALQRAKDKATSAFAIISAVADLPAVARSVSTKQV